MCLRSNLYLGGSIGGIICELVDELVVYQETGQLSGWNAFIVIYR